MKKSKYKKLKASLLFEVTIPDELWNKMDPDDRGHLEDLNRLNIRWKAGNNIAVVFHLGDVFKVRETLRKYGYTVAYPERAELNRYGLSYSGGSLDIKQNGDDFIVKQEFPDGRVETHVVPRDRVFRVYYIIKRWFEENKDTKTKSSVIWEEICKDFNITRFFDRSGKFHANSFFGDRKTYFTFAYYPLKILQHIGKIHYEGKYIYNPEVFGWTSEKE